jgi:arylsulfatase A-like enzyme
MARRIVAVALVILAGGAAWWVLHRLPPIESGACGRCNLLLITIDTLRTDRVGAFGGTRGLTPNLDRLAAGSVRFTRAYASAPLTLPSHASILTAVSPPVHGIRANGLFRLNASIPTLATVLHEAGYRTGGFVGAFVLDSRFGLNRGFDDYDDRYGLKHEGDEGEGAERRAEDVVKPAAAWIMGERPVAGGSPATSRQPPAAGQSPWFAWVHLYDPHAPYRAPQPYASRYEPYDAEVAYTDATVGRFLDELRAAHRLDHTVIVVTADHGESLGEHGELTHGVFAYDVTMRVPWFIWTGTGSHGRAFNGLARLIDLAPTALDLVGVGAPASFEGRSLLPAIDGRAAAPSTAYIEAMDANLTRNWAPLTGLVNGAEKLIDLPAAELYDLRADPGEATNLFARQPERARVLDALLKDALSGFASHAAGAENTTLSADARQRLQALGYVAMSADPNRRIFTTADDPKTLVPVSNELNRATSAFNAGDRSAAMARVRTIIEQHPTFTTAYGLYASMQRESGDLAGAIATLDDIVRRGIVDHRVMVVLAGYLMESGALDRAAQVLEAVIAAAPDDFEAYNSLGVVMMRAGRHDRAQAALRKAIEIDPTSPQAYANLGTDDLAAHRMSDAIDHLRHAIDLDPRQFDALYNLGIALYDGGRHDEARPYLELFVKTAPRARYAADIARIERMLESG